MTAHLLDGMADKGFDLGFAGHIAMRRRRYDALHLQRLHRPAAPMTVLIMHLMKQRCCNSRRTMLTLHSRPPSVASAPPCFAHSRLLLTRDDACKYLQAAKPPSGFADNKHTELGLHYYRNAVCMALTSLNIGRKPHRLDEG